MESIFLPLQMCLMAPATVGEIVGSPMDLMDVAAVKSVFAQQVQDDGAFLWVLWLCSAMLFHMCFQNNCFSTSTKHRISALSAVLSFIRKWHHFAGFMTVIECTLFVGRLLYSRKDSSVFLEDFKGVKMPPPPHPFLSNVRLK